MVAATEAKTSGKLGYRPSLDALRAISVLAVIFYHAGFTWMPGGFLGVEVFFVVSGFLITTLLVEERHHNGTISLRGFWFRRARRLLPALYLLLIVVPAVVMIFYRDAASRLLGDVVAALLYVSNWWQILLNESYFEAAGRPPVLRHLWSLAVEEQFYILFPIAFAWLLNRWGRVRTRNVLLAGAFGSALWMAVLYTPYEDPSRVYYGTDTRLSGLLLGAVAALVWSPWRTQGTPARSAGPTLDAFGIAALVAMGWFFLNVNEFDPFIYRGGFLLLDLVCVVLIAALVHPASRLSRAMGLAPLVWIGVRSYSIYLWHWPIFVMTRPELDVPLTGWPLFALRGALTLVAAEISFRFVETPIRRGAIGNYAARIRSTPLPERITMQRNFLLSAMGVVVAVLLVAGGLVVNAGNPDASESSELAQSVLGGAGETTEISDVAVEPTVSTQEESNPSPTDTAPASTAPVTVSEAPDGTFPTNAVAVGDSVMLGAATTMREVMPGARVDAEVSRQFDQIASAAEWFASAGHMPGPAIVQFGNNGTVDQRRMEQMVERLGSRKVLLVNAKVAKPWESVVNERTRAVAEKYDNTVFVDWHAEAVKHPEYLVSDGTHLSKVGMLAYARLIGSNL